MGTDSPVAPGSASNNQPSCSPRPTKTYSKTQSKTPNSNTSNKTHSKLSNKMGGTVASKHSLNQLHSKSKSPSYNSTRRTVPNKNLSTKKVRSNLNKLSIIQCNLHKAKSAWDSIASSFNDIKHPIFITTNRIMIAIASSQASIRIWYTTITIRGQMAPEHVYRLTNRSTVYAGKSKNLPAETAWQLK